MERLNKITLKTTLPQVFIGSENESPVADSEVWMRLVGFERGKDYLVEAESGTGKSSLCAFVYGNRRDYRGEILFDGTDIRTFGISQWCEIRRCHLAYLPQEMRLFPELTVMENIQIKNRLTKRFSEKEIVRMLGELDIEHKRDVVAARLSVGQQQRVAIIRALAQPFDFLLLDEPVSHLDRRNNLAAARLIAGEARRNGASIITTSVGNPLLLRELENSQPLVTVKL